MVARPAMQLGLPTADSRQGSRVVDVFSFGFVDQVLTLSHRAATLPSLASSTM